MVYSSPPQVMRFEAKLASHTAKWTASRNGTSHSFFFKTSSPIPHTPTVHAITRRRKRYAARNAAATEIDGANIAAKTAHGSPCVKMRPMYDHGRQRRTVRAQRT